VSEELDALLAGEIERRLVLLGGTGLDLREARAALHSLRGSAAMAGHTDLALVIGHYSARLRAGDAAAAREAAELLSRSLERLRSGARPFTSEWPEPPPGLGPSNVDPSYRGEYLAAVRDRLDELGALIDEVPPAEDALERATRAVHAIKGAAGAVGDDATAWYCHGLESRLKAARERGDDTVLEELPRHRSALGLLLEDQNTALETLRGHKTGARASNAPVPAQRRSGAPLTDEDTGEHTVRVQGVSFERLLERLEHVQMVHDALGGVAETTHLEADRMRDLRAGLYDALRLLGPARPWGPPAAALTRIDRIARSIGLAAEDLERESATCKRGADSLRVATQEIRREIASVRRTKLSNVLARVASSITRLAAREGRAVRVRVVSAEVPVDREIAERLVDPLMQLARNALAHGIESPDERRARDKEAIGTIVLSGERSGDYLRIGCEDDGRGVDVDGVRRQAVAHGALSEEAASAASDDELLALLFAPGLTTRPQADLLAGRGLGLELALGLVRRMGGTIRLASQPGSGLRATIEIPSERWISEVLWLTAGGFDLALPVAFAGKIARYDHERPAVHLARCLSVPEFGSAKLTIELTVGEMPTVSVGVERVGMLEECNIRPLPGLVSRTGPFSGAIVRGDGALHLALDAPLLAVRAWTLG
jgi:chemotaxis protein histidine kinase CheA